MSFVVDASVAASWYLPDEDVPMAVAALENVVESEAHVPRIWWYEVRNAFLIGERKGRVAPADTSGYLLRLSRLPIWFDDAAQENVLAVARTFDLTCYDAAYLELALRLRVPLASLDRRLAAAADRAGIVLFDA